MGICNESDLLDWVICLAPPWVTWPPVTAVPDLRLESSNHFKTRQTENGQKSKAKWWLIFYLSYLWFLSFELRICSLSCQPGPVTDFFLFSFLTFALVKLRLCFCFCLFRRILCSHFVTCFVFLINSQFLIKSLSSFICWDAKVSISVEKLYSRYCKTYFLDIHWKKYF